MGAPAHWPSSGEEGHTPPGARSTRGTERGSGVQSGSRPRRPSRDDAKPFQGAFLRGRVSSVPWFDSYPMDKRQWVMPDLLIPRTFADWAAGRDKVLDAVLADGTDGPADDAARERIFYWARESQSASWEPFWIA